MEETFGDEGTQVYGAVYDHLVHVQFSLAMNLVCCRKSVYIGLPRPMISTLIFALSLMVAFGGYAVGVHQQGIGHF